MPRKKGQKNKVSIDDSSGSKLTLEMERLRNTVQSELTRDLTANFLTIFGIFAAFVTFLSIEIQILETISEFWLLIGFSSFLLASIFLLAFAILNIAKNGLSWEDLKSPISIFITLFLSLAILSFYIQERKDSKYLGMQEQNLETNGVTKIEKVITN